MAIQTFVADTILTAAQMNALQGNDYNQTVSTKTASYTLVAADKGTKIVMNSASATTITVNTSLFSAGDTLTILNISTGVCTVTAGTATVSTTGSLALAQNGGGTLYFTSAGVSVFQANGVAASSGLVCVKAETAFTAVTSLTADNIFTSSYTNYRILVRFTTSADDPFFQLTAATVATTANYNWQRLLARSTTLTGAAASSASSAMFAAASSGDFFCNASLELFAPQLTAPTTFSSVGLRSDGAYTSPATVQMAGSQSGSIAFDGIKLLVATGTMTGIYSVYGYSKTV